MPIWSSALPSPPPPSPHILGICADIAKEMRATPRMAGPILSRRLRAARSLGSRDRPIAGDLLLGLIRHERALARIAPDPLDAWLRLAASGPPDLPDPDDPAEALAVALSLPGWIAAEWREALGEGAIALARTLAGRAPVFLRRLRPGAVELPVAATEIGARTIRLEGRCNLLEAQSWRSGQVEIQDLGSQQIVDAAWAAAAAVSGSDRPRILDLCAGAGGKSLSLAALGARVQAWDIRPRALEELRDRADRCGLRVRIAAPAPGDRWDLVLVDAPCSGTGVLRRHPENRWKLAFPVEAQRDLLRQAAPLAPRLLYATCALTRRENGDAPRAALPQAPILDERTLWPEPEGRDGFFMALLDTRGA